MPRTGAITPRPTSTPPTSSRTSGTGRSSPFSARSSAFAGSVGVFALTVCVWTLAEIVNAPTQTGLVVRLSPVHGRGRYQGVYTMSWAVASLVAPLMSGFVIDHWGSEWLWGICAVVGTVAAAGYGALMRGLGDETSVTATGEAPGPAAKAADDGRVGAL